ncbi:UNVERIFIED_CONTAM: hypothetical protein GTU68_048274, partial [Idotea baltica]|nr:hypothetical protein [Idotea baltica]
RDRWDNRVAFILAAVGSAVGIGNFWRFPGLTYKFGGAIFFVPYLFALFMFGIPMLVFEIGVGQKFQRGDIGVFASINKRIYGIGLCSVYASLVIACYYMVIISWSVYYFFASFIELYWAEGSDYANDCKQTEGDNKGDYKSSAENYFYKEVIKLVREDCSYKQPGTIEEIAWLVVVCVVFCWVLTFFATRTGTKSMSKIVYLTVPLPVILILIMLVRVIFLDGAGEGIK